jgi:dihydroorotase
MAELFDMKNCGAIAFGDYNKSQDNANLLKIALQYVQDFDGLVIAFPKTKKIKEMVSLMKDWFNSTRPQGIQI